MTMIRRTVRCGCGALTAEAVGDPVRNSICHCLDCKRRTGSAFSWNATYAEEQVTVAGEHSSFTRTSDDGFWVRDHFCPSCGGRVFYAIERRPGLISIPAGAFADPDFPAPSVEVYAERSPWTAPLAPDQE